MKIQAGRRNVEISKPDKVLFPDSGITKKDLAEYHKRASTWMLPYIRDRALTLERYPDGIHTQGFIQQNRPEYFPDWVGGAKLERKKGGKLAHIVCNNSPSLVYLADQGAITLHMWLSKTDKPKYPDRMVFDLDPPGEDFSPVRWTAKKMQKLFHELDLVPYLMTTGSKGVHILVPLTRSTDFDTMRDFAQKAAELMALRYPDRMTTEQRKEKRGDRVYLDVFRNGYGQTGVAPYTVRPKPGAPVAAPLDWKELDDSGLHAGAYTIKNIGRRMAGKSDPWKGMGKHARAITTPLKKLEDRLEAERTNKS